MDLDAPFVLHPLLASYSPFFCTPVQEKEAETMPEDSNIMHCDTGSEYHLA
jgi:hypothetical protein